MASMDSQEPPRHYKEHVESLDDEADPRGKAGRFSALTRAAKEIDLALSPPLPGAQMIEGRPPLSLPLPPRGTVSRTAVKSTKAAAPAKKTPPRPSRRPSQRPCRRPSRRPQPLNPLPRPSRRPSPRRRLSSFHRGATASTRRR